MLPLAGSTIAGPRNAGCIKSCWLQSWPTVFAFKGSPGAINPMVAGVCQLLGLGYPPPVRRSDWRGTTVAAPNVRQTAKRAAVFPRTRHDAIVPKLMISAIINSRKKRLSTSSSGARPARAATFSREAQPRFITPLRKRGLGGAAR